MDAKDEIRWLNEILPRVQEHARCIVYDQFIMLLNPKFRGPTWKWEDFETSAVMLAKVSIFQLLAEGDYSAFKPKIQEAAIHTARHYARLVLKDSGIVEWWPNPETT